jgi:hypothetical protein
MMRKIYLYFIVFFAVFIIIDWYFVPSKKFLKNQAEDYSVVTNDALDAVSYHQSLALNPEPINFTEAPTFDLTESEKKIFLKKSVLSDTLSWKLLGLIKYVKRPHPEYEEGAMYPIINSALKQKAGKVVVLSGYAIPIDHKSFALSKNTFAACFFCGKAGPETITGLHFKSKTLPKLKTDQYITIRGVFRTNEKDVEDWIYHIDQAVITKGLK